MSSQSQTCDDVKNAVGEAQPSAAFTPDHMTRDERSCLVYLETCAVDAGGLVEGIRMNTADHEAIERFVAAGLLQFNRIPACLLGTGGKSTWTHIVLFNAGGWDLASRLRQLRAKRHGLHATECIKELVARGKFAALQNAPTPEVAGEAAASGQAREAT